MLTVKVTAFIVFTCHQTRQDVTTEEKQVGVKNTEAHRTIIDSQDNSTQCITFTMNHALKAQAVVGTALTFRDTPLPPLVQNSLLLSKTLNPVLSLNPVHTLTSNFQLLTSVLHSCPCFHICLQSHLILRGFPTKIFYLYLSWPKRTPHFA